RSGQRTCGGQRTDPARSGRSSPRPAGQSSRDLLQASLQSLPTLFQRRHDGPGAAELSLHASCSATGGAGGGGGRPALSLGQLAFMARSPCVCAVCHDPELGRGRGEKRRPLASRQSTSTPPWPTSPATSPPMSSTTAPP